MLLCFDLLSRDRKGVLMGLRPTKRDEKRHLSEPRARASGGFSGERSFAVTSFD
jgi:hypothetical protein